MNAHFRETRAYDSFLRETPRTDSLERAFAPASLTAGVRAVLSHARQLERELRFAERAIAAAGRIGDA